MKKTVFLAFCLTLLLALTGCGASASGDTAQKSAAVNEVADATAAARQGQQQCEAERQKDGFFHEHSSSSR